MLFECVKQAGGDGWAVEAIDFGRDGQIARVLFIGLDDEFLAKEYCDWKNSSTRPHAGHKQHTFEVESGSDRSAIDR